MDIEEYISILYRTEQNAGVNKWQAGGFHVWPLFRNQTISMFRNAADYYRTAAKTAIAPVSFKDRLLNKYYTRKFLAEFRKALKQKTAPLSCDVLLYSKPASYTDKVVGKWYNRFIDPYLELLGKKYNVLKLELSEEAKIEKADRLYPPLYIGHEKFLSHFFYRYKNQGGLRLSTQAVFNEIRKETGIDFVDTKVDSMFREVICYRDLFLEIFKQVKPRFVFVKCYYEHDVAGLMLAAHELGIRTVDIQHGKQGLYHPMYSHFSAIPEKGYEILPDYFWCWGNESVENILRWRNRKDLHVPVTGGNLWMSKWKYEEVYSASSEKEKAFITSLAGFERVVMFSLQPIEKEKVIPEHVREAIRRSPPGWIWLLRKHPFQKISSEEILELAGTVSCTVETEYASALPLYFVLRHAHKHITLWSSVCFEADEFGVPTIIAHPFGAKAYDPQIKTGIFTYAETADDLLAQIRENAQPARASYIETSREVYENAFRELGLPLS